jgi:anthranilate synthase component 1
VRVEGRRVQTHPIAGTRPRGRTEADDQRLAEELKTNEKERAEHVMLVDLGRNDVGRVSLYGSVRVPTYMTI